MRKYLTILILLALPLVADDRSKDTLSGTHTDRFKVPVAGTIRVQNSFGEVTIDGWDRPEVELTVVQSTERVYGAKDGAEAQRRMGEAQRRLDSVQVTAKQQGNEVVVSTAYPSRNGFVHPLSRRSDIEVSYTIHAPRASKLVIDDNRGGVDVSDITGDVHATVINGEITLTLAPNGHYAIDAQAKIGDIYSDFEGRDQTRHVLGEEFESPATAPATNLYLRVRIGDILIQKLHGPPAD
jgi:hypothetical protein